MTLHKLAIFSKNTDATEALRGYEYQKLRTLEEWLINYTAQNSEVIYCDYEEDIFQRNPDTWASKFTQVKLYSSKSFSFSSAEVVKALSHFFMLFAKHKESSQKLEFVFETNTSVARSYGDNEASLLKDWYDNQLDLPDELAQRCAVKLRSILVAYAGRQIREAVNESLLAQMEEAKLILEQLGDTLWLEFAKSIRWTFAEMSPEVAIENVILKVNDLVAQTGFPAAMLQKQNVFARLYYAVSDRSIQPDPENRKLDNRSLDNLLLDTGNSSDKDYRKDYNAWSSVTEVTRYRAAEFYQVINLAIYCRRSPYLNHHSGIWLGLLQKYIALPQTPLHSRQNAIYELIRGTIRSDGGEMAKGCLHGLEDYVRLYFSSFRFFKDHASLAEASVLLRVVGAVVASDKAHLKMEEVDKWREDLLQAVLEGIKKATDNNPKCYYHEIAVEIKIFNLAELGKVVLNDVLPHLEAILALVKEARLFNVWQLSERVNAYVGIMVAAKQPIEDIERLEELADRLMPFSAAQRNDDNMARVYLERGAKYVGTREPLSVIRALNYFHKARVLWKHDHTKEGYVSVFLLIAELYAGIDNNLAAKFYAYAAASNAMEKKDLYKLIPDAFSLVLWADFQQGAWISCIEDFRSFIHSRFEFKPDPSVQDPVIFESFARMAMILALSPRLDPQLKQLMSSAQDKMAVVFDNLIGQQVRQINEQVTDDQLYATLIRKLNNTPLGDVGPERTITWSIWGSQWTVRFSNTWMMNSLGEEFVAITQILLTEFGLLQTDLQLIKASVIITIINSATVREPRQERDNHVHRWTIFMPPIPENDAKRMKDQPSFILSNLKFILNGISLLPSGQLFGATQSLFEDNDLAGKTMPGFIYQRLYRYMVPQHYFEEPGRAQLKPVEIGFSFHRESLIAWNDTLSKTYSRRQSLKHIRNRYPGMLRLSHLTLQHIKQDPRYSVFIATLRKDGWLDWQILLGITNHLLLYKASQAMKGRSIKKADDMQLAFRVERAKLLDIDESDNFVPVSLDYFMTLDFRLKIDQLAIVVLSHWGLEIKTEYPDFVAIREFLNVRYNFNKDDIPELSPL